MFSYETGVAIAFCLWGWLTIAALVALNSQLEKNLNKIGQRLSWLTLTPKPISPEEVDHSFTRKIAKFLLLYGTGLPFGFTSWLYVAYVVAFSMYRKSKDFGAPQAVREFRWKLKNIDLTFDQLVKELMKVSDQDPETFEQVKQDLLEELKERGVRVS